MKKAVLYLIAAAILVMAGGGGYSLRKRYKKEISGLKEQLAHAQQYVPMNRDTVLIHDTLLEVATSPVITAELSALRRQHIIDEQMIKDLGLKLKQLDAVQTTVTETKDTARAEYCHNLKVFSYDDRWSHLEFSLSDSTFYYNIRDSLATVIYHEYKHRFLWWRWGVKGYKVKILNFNPHSTVRYNRYVKPEK
ncbi:MAG: hypothetical protein IKH35_04545 [Prevotella sp.]|nr:hypothetical protein [Prevotella sp.]